MKTTIAFLSACLMQFFVVSPLGSAAADPAAVDQLAYSREWLRMLHYTKPWLGGYESRMDGKAFFFAEDGKTNPRSELVATVAAMNRDDLEVGKLKLHPQCAFPLRLRFLKERLGLSFKSVECPKLQEFLESFKAKTVSLMFSTAYPNNPGSMFGHTFLKFGSGTRSELLDQAISYAANVADGGGVLYMVRGVFGGYKGVFSRTPYYVKVNEYSNSESRDLWEYELDLTPDEVGRLLLHLWELEIISSFDYFFFDENCAFILLAALEAVKPEWNLTGGWFYVIPGETVKAVARVPGAVRRTQFRPSLRKKFFQAYGALSTQSRQSIDAVAAFTAEPAKLNEVSALDTASLYFKYVAQRDGTSVDSRVTEAQRATLLKRSTLGAAPGGAADPLVGMERSNDPLKGHAPRRLHLGGGSGFEGQFAELGVKFAYHDLLDRDAGYERFSHFDFPHATLRYFDRGKRVAVENVTGVAVTSLFPWTVIEKRWSWKFTLDYRTLKDLSDSSTHALHLDGGVGPTFRLTENWLVANFLATDFEVGEGFRTGWRIVPRYEFLSVAGIADRVKLLAGATVGWDGWFGDRTRLRAGSKAGLGFAFGQELALQLVLQNWYRESRFQGESQLRLVTYF